LTHLPKELAQLKKLRGLHLNGNKISPQEILELQVKLPELKIFY
jgi:Leucine-rich repeat (LRR) protein